MLNVSSVAGLPELALRPAQPGPAAGVSQQPGQDFAAVLGRLARDVAGTVQEGEAAAVAGIQGNLPLQAVVDRVMAAERTLQAALAVRDKTVSAYQEISRMQI